MSTIHSAVTSTALPARKPAFQRLAAVAAALVAVLSAALPAAAPGAEDPAARAQVDGAAGASTAPVRDAMRLPGVRFASASATLTASEAQQLDRVAAILRRNPGMRVEIAGYTDDRGSAAYNLALARRRAAAVRDALIARGVSAQLLTLRAYGEADPVADNSTPEGRARNRRVVLRVLE